MKRSIVGNAKLFALGCVLLAGAPRAFPCSLGYWGLRPVVSAWDEVAGGRAPRVGTSPVFFATRADELPEKLWRDDESITIDYTPVRSSDLVLDGIIAFVPRTPLVPGTYCDPYACVDVSATFDSAPMELTTSIEGHERTESGHGCSDATKCGGGKPRTIDVTVQMSAEDSQRLAAYRISLGAAPLATSPIATTIGHTYLAAGGYDLLDIMHGSDGMQFEHLKHVCVTLRPILWDATVLPPVDAGCVDFDRARDD